MFNNVIRRPCTGKSWIRQNITEDLNIVEEEKDNRAEYVKAKTRIECTQY